MNLHHVALWASFLALTITPPPAQAQSRPLDKSVYILLDTSGSMSGEGERIAIKSLNLLIDQLVAEGGYSIGLVVGSGTNVAVPKNSGTAGRIRAALGRDGSSGNPVTSLEAFTDRVMDGACSLVIVVTDGDDGARPFPAARKIKNACSRLFVIGVLESGTGVLRRLAEAGGGRFCNGRSTQQVARCLTGVMKGFVYVPEQNVCVNARGEVGLNPPPDEDEYSLWGGDWKPDLSCTDFRRIDPDAYPWTGYLLSAGVNHRGSDFSGLRLAGREMAGVDLTGARFGGADLTYAKIDLDGLGSQIGFQGANLEGATFSGKGEGCNGQLDFSSAILKDAQFHGADLCRVTFPAVVEDLQIEDSRIRKLTSSGAGLAFRGGNLGASVLEDVEVAGTLEIAGASLSGPEFIDVHAEILKLDSDIDARATFDQVSARKAARIGANYREFVFTNVSTPSMEGGSGLDLVIRGGSVGNLKADPEALTLSGVLVGGGVLQARQTSVVDGTVCDRCTLVFDRKETHLEVRGAALRRSVLRRDTVFGTRLTFERADLGGLQFESVDTSHDSSFVSVDLVGARFVKTKLRTSMRAVELADAVFEEHSELILIDGSEKVGLQRARIPSLEIESGFHRDLDLSDARIDTLTVRPDADVVLQEVDFAGATLKLESMATSLRCEQCRLDGAKLALHAPGMVLERGSAWKIDLTQAGSEGIGADLQLIGMDFSGARFGVGADLQRAFIEDSTFDGAEMAAIMESTTEASRFRGTVFKESIRESAFHEVDFSRARMHSGVQVAQTVFEETQFLDASLALSGATGHFADVQFIDSALGGADFDHASLHDVSFDGVRFNGASGPAKLKHIDAGRIVFRNSDLTALDLEGFRATQATLDEAVLRNVNLKNAVLRGEIVASSFDGADLTRANIGGEIMASSFNGAQASQVHFEGKMADCELRGLKGGVFSLPREMEAVDLTGAELGGASFLPLIDGAKLSDVNLDRAVIECGSLLHRRLQELEAGATTGTYTTTGRCSGGAAPGLARPTPAEAPEPGAAPAPAPPAAVGPPGR